MFVKSVCKQVPEMLSLLRPHGTPTTAHFQPPDHWQRARRHVRPSRAPDVTTKPTRYDLANICLQRRYVGGLTMITAVLTCLVNGDNGNFIRQLFIVNEHGGAWDHRARGRWCRRRVLAVQGDPPHIISYHMIPWYDIVIWYHTIPYHDLIHTICHIIWYHMMHIISYYAISYDIISSRRHRVVIPVAIPQFHLAGMATLWRAVVWPTMWHTASMCWLYCITDT